MATQQSTASKGRASPREKASGAPASSISGSGSERDEVYGLISVLYHALQGAETYARYCEDARRAGDDELLEFFEECQDDEVDRAERAKELLATRLDTYAEDAGDDDDDEDEDEEEVDDEEEIDEER
jgi:hypothetical protein